MSMDVCNGCGRYIDTDDDPDCYRLKSNPKRYWGDDGNYAPDHVCLCQWCREAKGLNDD